MRQRTHNAPSNPALGLKFSPSSRHQPSRFCTRPDPPSPVPPSTRKTRGSCKSLGARARFRRACALDSLDSTPRPWWTVTKPVLPASFSGARFRAAPAQRNEETGSPVRSRRLRAEGSGPPGLRERSREDGGCGRKCSEAVSSRFFLS